MPVNIDENACREGFYQVCFIDFCHRWTQALFSHTEHKDRREKPVMPFDFAAGVQKQHGQTFAIRVDRCFILQLMVLVLNCVSCFASGSSQSPVAMVARKSNRRVDFALFLL
jgi:hypothetical protein